MNAVTSVHPEFVAINSERRIAAALRGKPTPVVTYQLTPGAHVKVYEEKAQPWECPLSLQRVENKMKLSNLIRGTNDSKYPRLLLSLPVSLTLNLLDFMIKLNNSSLKLQGS